MSFRTFVIGMLCYLKRLSLVNRYGKANVGIEILKRAKLPDSQPPKVKARKGATFNTSKVLLFCSSYQRGKCNKESLK